MKDEKDFYYDEVFKEYKKRGDITEIGKSLGKGAYGIVKDVRVKNKTYAGKLLVKDTLGDLVLSQELRGPNIIKIIKICSPVVKYGNTYHLIIMEKAILRDLGKLNNFFHERNLLKLIYQKCFDEELADTVLRYFVRQIINGFETLEKNNYAHFDIKPENILITVNLILKISDFSMLKKLEDKSKDVNDYKIPGGTTGYLSPEYYLKEKVTAENAKKQDYFSLGCMIFLLKYGFGLLKFKTIDDKTIIADTIVSLLMRNTNYIFSQKLTDKDLITFLTNLVHIKPDYRYNIGEIHRNKWLNKNLEYIEKTVDDFETDEEKLLLELQKQDFLIQKKEIFEINKINDEHVSNTKKEINKKIKRKIGKCFKFKKCKYDIKKTNDEEGNK